jgi:hypothetical protein
MKNQPFQLEETVPGIFLLQGWLGGALSGFTYVVAVSLWFGTASFDRMIVITPIAMVAGGIIGVIKGTMMWAIYRLTGIRMGAFARVAVSSIAAFVLAIFVSVQFGNIEDAAIWLTITLSVAVPIALLVGSNVKPWELFTFGSIVVGGERIGSRSVLAALGTLPLRLLSLSGLAVWILLYSCRRPDWWDPAINPKPDVVPFLLPTIYFALTTYLTFRSPGKAFLPVWAVLLNLYSGFCAYFFFHTNGRWRGDEDWMLSVTAPAFIIAWAIFLIARLAAPTNDVRPLTILPAAPTRQNVVEHQCLGTRFVEWQKRVA